ncbi:hypothetical protein [Shewanella nanhaiensis]|uniref:Uncharacterized protein n=1 Tax=Shewanella nanhaiensis TaxID=2864872 RepID=A0ABS7E5U9_9GAMM|nr:hypothetical protein [Shewanella nanhaiensis]MBW8185010.1 hypothetical protein [Shewanella nanhaiensis]
MVFERVQKQNHHVADSELTISYDRFTTRFTIKAAEEEVIYSALLMFIPIRNKELSINNQLFTLKIRWLILWQSKLENSKGVVIKELLYLRRRKSINLFIYLILITSIKAGIILSA